jgi:hypothetical protein
MATKLLASCWQRLETGPAQPTMRCIVWKPLQRGTGCSCDEFDIHPSVSFKTDGDNENLCLLVTGHRTSRLQGTCYCLPWVIPRRECHLFVRGERSWYAKVPWPAPKSSSACRAAELQMHPAEQRQTKSRNSLDTVNLGSGSQQEMRPLSNSWWKGNNVCRMGRHGPWFANRTEHYSLWK